MATATYPKFKESLLLSTTPDLTNVGTVLKFVLVSESNGTPYAYNTAHQYLTSVPAGSRIDISEALTGVTATNGVLDANNATALSVTGDTVDAAILFIDTGVEATSMLIAFYDGLSLVPNGNNVLINVTTNLLA